MQFLNGYIKLLPPWGPMEEADGEYGRISLIPGMKELAEKEAAEGKSSNPSHDQYGSTSETGLSAGML